MRTLLLGAFCCSIVAGELAIAEDANNAVIPPLLKLGDTGDRVLELQATLNSVLSTGSKETFDLSLFGSDSDVKIRVEAARDVKTQPRIIYDGGAGREFKLILQRNKWTVNPDTNSITLEAGKNALKVDGIYGPQTFVAVLLFQIRQGLQPTGQVDAVSLDRLEPLVPPNFLLARLMAFPRQLWNPVSDTYAWWVKQSSAFLMFLLLLVVSFVVHMIARNLARSTEFLSQWVITPTSSCWFTTLKDSNFFTRIAHFVPAIFLCLAANVFPSPGSAIHDPFPYLDVFEKWHLFIERVGLAYIALTAMMVIQAYLDACHVIFASERPKDNPIEGILNAARRTTMVVGLILIAAALAGRNPAYFVGGLGAITAVIMLVFKDALLGLVASVQIVANNMVKVGDWIEIPSFKVDGNVIGISLTTIKVRNFDKTISSIPTYGVISESFKNWRGMQDAGSRRMKRSIYIDMNSVKPLTLQMVEHLGKIELLSDYLGQKREDLRTYFTTHNVLLSPANGRWLTNVGTFRVYLEKLLLEHPSIDSEQGCVVRQLQPGRDGLPLEICTFTNTTNWAEFETIQSDLFDRIISILPEFELRIFQDPTEHDYEGSEQRYGIQRIDHDVTLGITGETETAKFAELQNAVDEQNAYLEERPRARPETAAGKIDKEIIRLDLEGRVTAHVVDRRIELHFRT